MMRELERLGKWRSFFAGWMFGTQDRSHGPSKAVKDLVERSLVLRVEVSALTKILIDAGVTNAEEVAAHVEQEARYLSEALSKRFPGVQATDEGLRLDVQKAVETMRREGFPP